MEGVSSRGASMARKCSYNRELPKIRGPNTPNSGALIVNKDTDKKHHQVTETAIQF